MKKHKFATMDATRGVAAICILIFHLSPFEHSYHIAFGNAPVAVDFFFCLSGFVLAYSYGSRIGADLGTTAFVWRRTERLLPMYVLGTSLGAICAVIALIGGPYNSIRSTAAVMLFAVFFLPYFRSFTLPLGEEMFKDNVYPLDGNFWSLFFEFVVNWLWAVAGRIRVGSLIIIIGGSYLYVAMTTPLFDEPAGWSFNNFIGGLPRATFSFFAGVGLFALWQRGTLSALKVWPIIPCLLIFALCAVPYRTVGYLTSVVAAVVIVALSTGNPKSAVALRICSFLGSLSYPLYAIHVPLLMLTTYSYDLFHHQSLATPLSVKARVVLGAVAIMVSAAVAYGIDRPAQKYMRARTGSPKPAPDNLH